jgi:hypothetical protein
MELEMRVPEWDGHSLKQPDRGADQQPAVPQFADREN